MANACSLYFFVKTSLNPPEPKFDMLTTVVWMLGQRDTAIKGQDTELKIHLTESLKRGGPLGGQVYFHTFVFKKGHGKDHDEKSCMALLKDPNFTWKDDALAISLHRIEIEPTNTPIQDPFCVPLP